MHYHLIGICGTAMASLAGMLQARGHRSRVRTRMFIRRCRRSLRRLGSRSCNGYQAENARHRRRLRRSSATRSRAAIRSLKKSEPQAALSLAGRDRARKNSFAARRSLVVAGTHGKTTTTSIAAWVCEVGGLDPSFPGRRHRAEFRRELSRDRQRSFCHRGRRIRHGVFRQKAEVHALPARDRDRQQHRIRPRRYLSRPRRDQIGILASDESRARQTAALSAGVDSPVVREVLAEMDGKLFTNVETFGLSDDAKWQARYIDFTGDKTRFTVFKDGKSLGRI